MSRFVRTKQAISTVLALFVATGAVMAHQAMPASPRGTAAIQIGGKWVAAANGEQTYQGGKWIVVDYGRPILRGRTNIFGKGADYGKKVSDNEPVWRAGANQTTRIKTDVPMTIGGKSLIVGEYALQVELKEGAWTLIVSSQPWQEKYDANDKTRTWGNYGYDKKFDLVRVPMKLKTTTESNEQFTIAFMNVTPTSAVLTMWWDTQMASVDIKF